jgi:hypothetical protein
MKNIILPIDFSDTTETLLEGAVDFEKEITDEIISNLEVGQKKTMFLKYLDNNE